MVILLPMMSHWLLMKHHMVAAWKNFHLAQTKLKFFNAALIAVSKLWFMTEAKLIFGFF